MSLPEVDEVLSRAKRGAFAPVTLLVGDEPYLVDRAVKAIRRASVGDGMPGLNEDVFDGQRATASAVIGAARTLAMMSPVRFVLVRSIDKMKPEEWEALAGYVADPVSSACVVMTAEKLDGRSKLAKVATKAGAMFEAKPLKGAALAAFAQTEARAKGHTLGPDACHHLLDAIGQDLGALEDALERLSLYVGAGKPIDTAAIDACVVKVRTETIWLLVDSIGGRDARRATQALSSLLADDEEPIKITAMLARQMRMIARMREALESGMREVDAAQAAGAPPFKARDLAAQARRQSVPELARTFAALAALDRSLKSSKVPSEVLVTEAVIAMCASSAAR